MINPVWLRTFCAVTDSGNFTRAAESLYMTQSGVSQHIKKLEEAVGATLVDRQEKVFTLTDAGKQTYISARQILTSLETLSSSVANDSTHEGEIVIMTPGSVGLKLNGKLLALQQEHAGLIIDHRFAPNSDIEAAVSERKADVGLMTRIPESSLCVFHKIGEERLLLVTPQMDDPVSLPLLEELGFIGHPDGAHHANLLLNENIQGFTHIGQIKKRGFSNQINLILQPVSMGMGFTVLPEFAVAQFPQPEKLKIQPLAKGVSEPLFVVTRQGVHTPKRIGSLLEKLEDWLW